MKLKTQHWRLALEWILLVISLLLATSFIRLFGWPDSNIIAIFSAWIVYFIVQQFFKLGLTLPFGFIVLWMIMAIMEWNENQEIKSFDLEDYQLAISYVINALNGAVIYFENKMRW